MPIRAVRAEGHHHIGFHAAYMPNNLGDRLCRGGLIQVTINVIQEIDLANTKRTGGCQQLGLASLTQRFQPWIIGLVAKPATLATRSSDKICFYPLASI